MFLTSCGFRLPGEAQKVDRMLVAFSKAYVKDNPNDNSNNAGVFSNADAAFILAFALVMLNTDQHNASMKGRQPMTEQQFISNLRGVNDGSAHRLQTPRQPTLTHYALQPAHTLPLPSRLLLCVSVDFPRSMLAEAYHSIKNNEIAFLADRRAASSHSRHATLTSGMLNGSHQQSAGLTLGSSTTAAGQSPTLSSAEGSGEVARSVSKYKAIRDSACRSFLEQLVRKTLAYLKNAAVQQRALYLPVDSRIVIGMYDVSWLKCCAAITATLETSRDDVDTLHCCLDGLMYGACIAVALRLPMERQAFTRVLAKLTFMERQCGSFSAASLLLNNVSDEHAADCQRRVLAGDHLRQEWCRAANLYSDKQPLQAMQLIQHTCRDTAKKLNSERRLSLLKQLQEAFGNEIALTDNQHRALVKQGKLTKISSDGKRRTYFFFLFNDVLVYASAGVQQRYKCHRCLHLSLCRIEDIKRRTTRSERAAAASEVPTTPPAAATEPSISSRPSSAPSTSSPASYATEDDGATDSQSTTFRIVSPQKSILLCADTADKKRAWIGALLAQMKHQARKRGEYVRQAHQHTLATATTAATQQARQQQPPSTNAESTSTSTSAVNTAAVGESDSSDELRRYSTFIGSDWSSRAASVTPALSSSLSSSLSSRRPIAPSPAAPDFCKLCLRSFTLFRRRVVCEWCSDAVCNECADNRVTLPADAPATSVSKSHSSGTVDDDKHAANATRSTSDLSAQATGKEQRGDKARVCDACCGVLTGVVALAEAEKLYTQCLR